MWSRGAGDKRIFQHDCKETDAGFIHLKTIVNQSFGEVLRHDYVRMVDMTPQKKKFNKQLKKKKKIKILIAKVEDFQKKLDWSGEKYFVKYQNNSFSMEGGKEGEKKIAKRIR